MDDHRTSLGGPRHQGRGGGTSGLVAATLTV